MFFSENMKLAAAAFTIEHKIKNILAQKQSKHILQKMTSKEMIIFFGGKIFLKMFCFCSRAGVRCFESK